MHFKMPSSPEESGNQSYSGGAQNSSKVFALLHLKSDFQTPNLFLWLLSDLPRGRHPNQGAGHLGSCKGQQEDSLNQWKWERDLPRGQKALHRVEKNGGIWLSAQL